MNSPAFLAQSSGGAGSPSLISWVPLIFAVVFAYLMFFGPQKKKQKEWQAALAALKSGDRVVTVGGIRGTVIAVKDDSVHLRVPPDNLRLEVVKTAIASVGKDEEKSA